MSFWDVILMWALTKLFASREPGPQWPAPPGPTGPAPTGPTGPTVKKPPVGSPPGTTGPGPTGPAGDVPPTQPPSAWQEFWYTQPDAGAAYGTPWVLAQAWVKDGNRWIEMYNYTKGRPIGATKGHGDVWVDPKASLHGETTTDYPADVGDKLLIPTSWGLPPNATITARTSPIPPGTPLPGAYSSPAIHGDEDSTTI